MSKTIAERSNPLSISWLKKNGYLPTGGGIGNGTIVWTHGLNEDRIRFSIFTNMQDDGKEDHLRLRYINLGGVSGEKESMNYKVLLAPTACNFGGLRYWFSCPLCEKRVGVLYDVGRYFCCRYCGKIAYASQMKGGRFRESSVRTADIERLENEIKRYFYNGEPTRKYVRLMSMRNKFVKNLQIFTDKLVDM